MRKALFLVAAGAALGCAPASEHDAYLSKQLDNLALRVRHLEDRLSTLERSTRGLARRRLSPAVSGTTARESLPVVPLSGVKTVDLSAPLSTGSAGYLPSSSSVSGRWSPSGRKASSGGDAFTRLVQKALKRAGYDPGAIDGRMGRRTKQALERFQRAKGLKVTGSATPATWRLLRKYL